jgi:hypothetical protein
MTLRSESSIHILDLLCEGTIEGWGFDDNLMKKGTFLNETPVMDADGTVNFDAVNVELKHGTYDQDTPLYGSTVSTQTSVGVEVGENYNEQLNSNGFIKNDGAARFYGGGSVSRTITNTSTDHFSCLFSNSKRPTWDGKRQGDTYADNWYRYFNLSSAKSRN